MNYDNRRVIIILLVQTKEMKAKENTREKRKRVMTSVFSSNK